MEHVLAIGKEQMGIIAVACYMPKPRKGKELGELVRRHYPALKALGLATDRKPILMKAKNGMVVEVFEWASATAKRQAHADEVIRKIWTHMEAISENVPLSRLEEATEVFANFTPL
jgi:hypothetical protein